MIVCDNCKKEPVLKNGEICDECTSIIEESKIDRSYLNSIYLPDDLFEKFVELHKNLDKTKPNTLKALSKFMQTLGSSFINKLTGKEINDPTPIVIQPQENTLDRITKLLNHNLNIYAAQNNFDTEEDLDDWNIADLHSDDWEQTLYQYVESVEIMKNDELSNQTEKEKLQDDDMSRAEPESNEE